MPPAQPPQAYGLVSCWGGGWGAREPAFRSALKKIGTMGSSILTSLRRYNKKCWYDLVTKNRF